LSALTMQRYGYGDGLGIDNHFLRTAGSKAIIELESIWQQLEFFHDFSDQEQEAMLIGTLDDIARGPELFQIMMDAWRAGADAELDSLLNNDAFRNDAAAQRLYRVLIVDRNAAMTDKLAALLKRGGTYFVVVGAAHLVGDQGIVSQLRERGYRIGRHKSAGYGGAALRYTDCPFWRTREAGHLEEERRDNEWDNERGTGAAREVGRGARGLVEGRVLEIGGAAHGGRRAASGAGIRHPLRRHRRDPVRAVHLRRMAVP